MNYGKDPADPTWNDDPGMKKSCAFIDKYYPEGDKTARSTPTAWERQDITASGSGILAVIPAEIELGYYWAAILLFGAIGLSSLLLRSLACVEGRPHRTRLLYCARGSETLDRSTEGFTTLVGAVQERSSRSAVP